ncbi:CHAT domain-containing protein [Nostoc sp. CHAB 5714]|uniref:CHAT domain-containing protein n=1 Tax=Nostoc favosum CHAB5714 TaxID=2780399 RepID=A0ABS8IA60_9NOSO|nr:CHAT domain-containing protein [Nostoc favosum CHAB5714]
MKTFRLARTISDWIIQLARCVIVSLTHHYLPIFSTWDVSDISTVALMSKFYGNLSKNADKAGALRQTMLETMKSIHILAIGLFLR